MWEFIGLITAMLVIGAMIVAALVAIALPLGWLWMLIDALLRDDADYPGASANARLMWVLLMALLPVTAFAYFFIVFVRIKRGAAGSAAGLAADPATASLAQATVPPPPAPAVG